jgi:hypothetical protein
MAKYQPKVKQVRALLDFAIEQKCVINPTGYQVYLNGFNEFKSCQCDKTRLTCPCLQAAQEVAKKGHCVCHMFWRSYEDYIKAKNL